MSRFAPETVLLIHVGGLTSSLPAKSKLQEKIGYAHIMFFPLDNKNNGTVYFSTHSVNADGKKDSFPSFKGL